LAGDSTMTSFFPVCLAMGIRSKSMRTLPVVSTDTLNPLNFHLRHPCSGHRGREFDERVLACQERRQSDPQPRAIVVRASSLHISGSRLEACTTTSATMN
jgi:hypothetical protein